MSRIRTNVITNRMANGAPTVSNGLVISGVTTTSDVNVGQGVTFTQTGNATFTGIVTATSFVGSGANLTSLPAGQLTGTVADARISTLTASKLTGALPAIDGSNLTGVSGVTINNNADNRVITGSGSANTLEGESQLLFTGTNLGVGNRTSSPDERLHVHTSSGQANIHVEGATDGQIILRSHSGDSVIHFGDASATSVGKIQYDHGSDEFRIHTNSNERLRIDSSGNVMIGRTAGQKPLSVRKVDNSSGVHIVQTIGGNSHVSGYAVGLGFDPEGYEARTKIAIVAEGIGQGYSRGKLHFLLDEANDSGEATLSQARMTITDAGTVTKPSQPSFAAYRNTDAYSLNGDDFSFNATIHNIGSHFNTSNYRFTAPVAGRYLFTFYSILQTQINNGVYSIRINGGGGMGQYVHFTTYNSSWDHVSTSWILNLSANDYVTMRSDSNIGWHGNSWQRFCGELLS